MGFYLVPPSGSSFNFFPENTLANFSTKLYESVNLKDEWEWRGGNFLPHTYHNIEDGELSLTKIVHDGRGGTSDSPSLIEYDIPGDNHCTIKGLFGFLQ